MPNVFEQANAIRAKQQSGQATAPIQNTASPPVAQPTTTGKSVFEQANAIREQQTGQKSVIPPPEEKVAKQEPPKATISKISTYSPDKGKTNYLYSPEQTGNYPPSETHTLPESTTPKPKEDILSPVIGHPYQAHAEKVPGRENPAQSALPEAKQFLHDMGALGALALARINRVVPTINPEHPLQPEWQGKSPIEAQDLPAIGEAAKQALPPVYLTDRYVRPLLHGDTGEYGRMINQEPITTGLDLLSIVEPLHIPGIGMMKGAVNAMQKSGKGARILETAENIKNTINSKVTKMTDLIPELHARKVVGSFLKEMSPEEAQALRKMEGDLTSAYQEIKPEDRPGLYAALEHTDPRYEHLLQKPEIAKYAAIQEHYSNQYWNALLQHGLVNKEDWLATRVFPRWAAKVKRGEIDFPVVNLTTEDAYRPEIQKELAQYAKEQVAQDKKAFEGAYNPVAQKGKLSKWRRGEPLRPGELKQEVTSKRLQSAIQTSEIKGQEVTGLRDETHIDNVAMNMARKLDLTAKFLNLYKRLEEVTTTLEALPEAARAIAAQKLETILQPLLLEAGIDESIIAEYQKISYMAVEQNKKSGTLEAIKKAVETGQDAAAAASKILQGVATFQRTLSILGDFVWPHLLHIQQHIIFYGTQLKPGSIVNALLASKLANNEKVFSKIPSEFLEHREPVGYKNPILRFFSEYAQQGYDAADTVRGAAAITQMCTEYDKLHPLLQGHIIENLKSQLTLSGRLKAFLKTKNAMEGGAQLGKDAAFWESFTKDLQGHIERAFGKYKGPFPPALEALRTGSIWANMTWHAMTLLYETAYHNPFKLMALREASKEVGAQQIMAGKSGDLPDWVINIGGWDTGKKAPDGYALVQFDSGFNLLIEAARSGINLWELSERFLRNDPHEPEQEGNPFDAQLNFLFAAGEIWAGNMPYGHRAMQNPYHRSINNLQYNVFELANQLNEGQTLGKGTLQKDVVTMPFDTFYQRAFITGGLGLSPKKWSWLKTVDSFARKYQPSDVTVPFTSMMYPKINLETGKLAPAAPRSPLDLIPGGHRLAPNMVRRETPQSAMYDKLLEMNAMTRTTLSPSAKAYLDAIKARVLLNSLSDPEKQMLPQY